MPILNPPKEACRVVIPNPPFELLNNLKRSICMLKKVLYRVARNNYYQYPDIFFEIEETLDSISTWINDYKNFAVLHNFSIMLGILIQKLSDVISQLIHICKPANGKKRVSKEKQVRAFRKSIDLILENIAEFLEKLKINSTDISIELEKWIKDEFKIFSSKVHEICKKVSISKRGEKTYVFPCADRETYMLLVNDRKRFRIEVVDQLKKLHLSNCLKNSVRQKTMFFGRFLPFYLSQQQSISIYRNQGVKHVQ
ncbi:MAG: hypothetical protein HQK75_20850 [Candidatus Magnetomorum sp.]|nr:hypothetical protein [Candidatus Magnetomorum sp.]